METTNALQNNASSSQSIQPRTLYLLNGNTLLPLAPEYLETGSPSEKNFRSVKELEELVLANSKTFFGKDIHFIPLSKESKQVFKGDFTPSGFLLNVTDLGRPEIYFVNILPATEDFYGLIFPGITRYFLLLKSDEFIDSLCNLLSKDKTLSKELREKMKQEDIPYFLKAVINSRLTILLVTDGEIKLLEPMKEVYFTWENVKNIQVKKYSSNGNIFCSLQPPFASLIRPVTRERKKRNETQRDVTYTEDFHLEGVSENVRNIYSTMKTELLKIDKELQFNPQKYYISLRKNKNLAFFKLLKSKITLVVMNPEADTRKQMKHYEVRALKESVQKFYNGQCCEILIENTAHLKEVITLLQKLIAA